jgi:hypothetical protein
MRILSLVLACAIGLIAAPAVAIDLFESEDGQTRFAFTGYAQPYYRLVDNPCSYSNEGECTRSTVGDGFGLTRARIAFEGQHGRSDFKVEIRTIPNVELLELRLRFDITDGFLVTAGRFRVPFSRQELTSESRLQLIDRAALIKGTPGRQLGLGITLSSDVLRSTRLPDDLIRLDAGVFNGESAKERAPVNNIDENFLYAARLAVNPFGGFAFSEADVRDPDERHRPLLSIAGSTTWERRGEGNGNYRQQNLGADLSFRWHGFSFYTEYFRYTRNFDDDVRNADYIASGYNVQAGWFIPAPYVRERLEIAGRVQEWDPQTAADPARADELLSSTAGSGPARGGEDTSTSTQAHRDYVLGLNWYFRGHDLKLQANYTWRTEIEDFVNSRGNAAIPRDVDDNTFFLQLTYRF